MLRAVEDIRLKKKKKKKKKGEMIILYPNVQKSYFLQNTPQIFSIQEFEVENQLSLATEKLQTQEERKTKNIHHKIKYSHL